MSGFSFVGKVPLAQSIVNRFLIAASYKGQLTDADHEHLKAGEAFQVAIQSLLSQREVVAPEDSVELCLLVFRALRQTGKFLFKELSADVAGSDFFSDMEIVLRQLGGDGRYNESDGSYTLESRGWTLHGDGLTLHSKNSDVIGGAVLSNTWQLDINLPLSMPPKRVFRPQFELSYLMLKKLGWNCSRTLHEFDIRKGQVAALGEWKVEPDMEISYLLAAMSAFSGTTTITNFPIDSIQSNSFFPYILEDLGASVKLIEGQLQVKHQSLPEPFEVDLSQTLGMFILTVSIAACISEGDSFIKEINWGQAGLKESWESLHPVLEHFGCRVLSLENAVRIKGAKALKQESYKWDIHNNRELFFAAAFLKRQNWNLEVDNYDELKSKYSSLWDIFGWE